MKDTSKKSSDTRRQHNADLLRRMRAGETLTSFDSRASWFPPRPIIQKDQGEIARLYQNASPRRVTAQSEGGLAVVSSESVRKVPFGEAS